MIIGSDSLMRHPKATLLRYAVDGKHGAGPALVCL
jgi:hypothetical protein